MNRLQIGKKLESQLRIIKRNCITFKLKTLALQGEHAIGFGEVGNFFSEFLNRPLFDRIVSRSVFSLSPLAGQSIL
jgi:hypothetical protein